MVQLEVDEARAVLEDVPAEAGELVVVQGQGTEDGEAGKGLVVKLGDLVVRQPQNVKIILRQEHVARETLETIMAEIQQLQRSELGQQVCVE